MNFMHLVSQISRSGHANGLLLDIDDSYTSCKYILDDVVLIRSYLRKGHDLDLKLTFKWLITGHDDCYDQHLCCFHFNRSKGLITRIIFSVKIIMQLFELN